MDVDFSGKLVIAISSRALFDLDESHAIYQSQGLKSYCEYQKQNEQIPLKPGMAFDLVTKLLMLNEGRDPNHSLVEIIMLSRNTADTGLRIFNSIAHYQLNITRAAFCGGQNPHLYAKAFGAHLFLSLNANDVHRALRQGCAAARICPPGPQKSEAPLCLKIAFDGDSVLFSDEAERIYQHQGLGAFNLNEEQAAKTPLPAGPIKGFLMALHDLQTKQELPLAIRTALVTARSAPAHERVIHTLRHWGVRIDESLFLGGLDKSPFVEAFEADIFFEDKSPICESTAKTTTTAHVPFGILNQEKS